MLHNINSNMERTDHGMNLHRISLRRQVTVEGNVSEDYTAQKVGFPYSPFGRPNARVRTPSSERFDHNAIESRKNVVLKS